MAEKLTILNERGLGMLTRIYNIKKVRKLLFLMLKWTVIFCGQVFSKPTVSLVHGSAVRSGE